MVLLGVKRRGERAAISDARSLTLCRLPERSHRFRWWREPWGQPAPTRRSRKQGGPVRRSPLVGLRRTWRGPLDFEGAHMATKVPPSPALTSLSAAGVSIWLDELSRDRIRDGELARDMAERSVVGVTTNPSIFAKAVSGSSLYDPQIADLASRGVDVGEAVRTITATDVREACDVMRPLYDATDGVDGRVSIEVCL